MKLLHVNSSILGDNSTSRALSAAVVARLRAENGAIEVVQRDLVAEPLPHLTQDRMAGLAENSDLRQFLDADVIVIGAGMYNFTIATQLKAWVDRILVAGKTFQYGANGPEGLAGGKRVIVALARGGHYAAGTPAAALEHAETYLRATFAFIGVPDVEFIFADGMALGEEARDAATADALRRVERLAA